MDEVTTQTMLANIQETKQKIEDLKRSVVNYIQENELENVMSVESFQDRIEVNLGNKVLFESGSSVLREGAKTILTPVSDMFKETDGLIMVEGHTDDEPIHTERYESNWDLSSARASSVVNFMSDSGVAENRFIVVGYSEFRPLVENVDVESRSRNRRVKIVLKPYESSLNKGKISSEKMPSEKVKEQG